MKVHSNRNQDNKAVTFAREAGLQEGESALFQMSTGATIHTPEHAGELVTASSNVVTLHFCSSGWKYLEKLPERVLENLPFEVTIIGELPEGIPMYSFVEADVIGTLRHGKLCLEMPRLIRAAAIPKELVRDQPWGHDWGRRTVPAFEKSRDFAEWFDGRCVVLRDN